MNIPPGAIPTLLPQDESHLNLLATLHYVFAGLGALGGAFLAAHYWFMNAMMTGQLGNLQGSPPPPPELLMVMKVMYVVCALVLGLAMVLNVLSARLLRQRRHRTFSMVVAGLNCLQIPLGTTLGVFTFIVLMRESVRMAYDQRPLQK